MALYIFCIHDNSAHILLQKTFLAVLNMFIWDSLPKHILNVQDMDLHIYDNGHIRRKPKNITDRSN